MTSYLRYKQHLAVLDADDTDIESWITVRGNHIPIKKGQSKEEAVKSFLEKKGQSSNQVKKQSTPELTKGQVRMYRDIDDRYVIVDPDGSYTFWKNGKKGGQNRSLNRFEGAISELESIGYKRAHNLNKMSEKEPESKQESSKSEKQGSLKEKMQKIIQRNGKVYGWETEGLEKFAENVEGKPIEQLKELHKAYKDRVAKLGMWVDTPTKLQEQFLGEVIEEQSKLESKTSNPNGTEGKSKTESKKTENKQDESWGGSHPKFDKLTEKYMPDQGEADNELGEILRSINRVAYRYYNDGDRWNQGYGKETVNWAVNYLEKVSKKEGLPNEIANGLTDGVIMLKGSKLKNKYGYEQGIKMLIQTLEHASESDLESLAKMKRNK